MLAYRDDVLQQIIRGPQIRSYGFEDFLSGKDGSVVFSGMMRVKKIMNIRILLISFMYMILYLYG